MFEDHEDMFILFNIDPELTCQCDEKLKHICQQCMEDESDLNSLENQSNEC